MIVIYVYDMLLDFVYIYRTTVYNVSQYINKALPIKQLLVKQY